MLPELPDRAQIRLARNRQSPRTRTTTLANGSAVNNRGSFRHTTGEPERSFQNSPTHWLTTEVSAAHRLDVTLRACAEVGHGSRIAAVRHSGKIAGRAGNSAKPQEESTSVPSEVVQLPVSASSRRDPLPDRLNLAE